jgi:AcrR family transcriptional regulator
MTKNKIKEIALKHFANKGYEETSLSMITSEVGIKTPSFYAFYKSKEELFLMIVHEAFYHHFEHIAQVTKSFSSETTTERKLFKILEEMYRYHIREEVITDFCRRFIMFPPEGLGNLVREEFLKSDLLLSNVLEEIFQIGIQNGEVRKVEVKELLLSYLCLMDGLFAQLFYYDRDPIQLEQRLRVNWNIYWSGIRNNHR